MNKIWFLHEDSLDLNEDFNKLLVKLFEKEFQKDFKIINIKDVVCCLSNERGLHITDKKGEIINPPKIVY